MKKFKHCDRYNSDAVGSDLVLSILEKSDFDELWLFGLEVDNGLSKKDIAGVNAFLQHGGGILTTRDRQDMGCSMCGLVDIGEQKKRATCLMKILKSTYVTWLSGW
ncbi:MAG: hypothetical protein V7K55_20645 [Nostoc sp.]|uniref:hypothetical protein n=1 Tax=Nostoc sp. TaxID=1180 RepID=UPI002FFB41E3